MLGICVLGLFFLSAQSSLIKKLSTKITIQEVHNGVSTKVEAEVYYTSNGNVTTHFTYPNNYVLLANNKGEYQVYNPQDNTIKQNQHTAYNTETTFFSHFLNNRTNDMGLQGLGFKLNKTDFENNLMISTWQPQTLTSPIAKVSLVHENQIPIYLDYADNNNNTVRKVYFYDYKTLQNYLQIPTQITAINYFENGDSTIHRTQYHSFEVNQKKGSSYFDFKIPKDAKLVK